MTGFWNRGKLQGECEFWETKDSPPKKGIWEDGVRIAWLGEENSENKKKKSGRKNRKAVGDSNSVEIDSDLDAFP